MTDKEKLIKLDSNIENIQIIEDYLNYNTLNIDDYFKIFMHLIKIKIDLFYFENAYKDLFNYYHTKMQSIKEKDQVLVLDTLFSLSIKMKKYDLAYQYYLKLNEILPVNQRYKALINLIEYKKLVNEDYIEDINLLLKDVIPFSIKLDYINELLQLYIDKNRFEEALLTVEEIKKIDPSHSYLPIYFKLLNQTKRYEELKQVATTYKNHSLYKMEAQLSLLSVYLFEKDYHKATILDADFSSLIDNESIDYQKRAYSLLIELYKEVNNKFSLDLYAKKLKSIEKTEKKQNESKKEEVNITKNIQLDNEKVKPFESKKQTNITKKDLNLIIDLLAFSNQIAETKSLRDLLRIFLMRVEESIFFKEATIFYTNESKLFNYKKERLYDKVLDKSTYQNTIVSEILKDGEDRFGNFQAFTGLKDINTLKEYSDEVKYIYAYPLFDIGVFMVTFDIEIEDPGQYYDLLKGIAGIIYSLLINDEKRKTLRDNNNFLESIINSDLIPIRIMSRGESKYNIAAQKLLNVTSYIQFEVFINSLGYHEARDYEKIITNLYDKKIKNDSLIYIYQNKKIKENFTTLLVNNIIYIISTYEDLTDYFEEKTKLINNATIDFETSLLNINALNEDLAKYIKDKGSFILVSFNESILPIYGYDITLQFFKEFGQVTKKFFKDGQIYRFSNYEIFIFIEQNDIRTVTKMVREYIKYIDKYVSNVINYEKFNPKLSIIRYPVVTEEKNPSKIFRYLELSLDYLKRITPHEDYIFFEYKIYEDEIFEQTVINYLNEAIEKNQFSLNFNQIIDTTRNIVWQYESDIVLENIDVDSKYLYSIARKRNRLNDLEKYHIEMVCQFLSTLEKETSKLIKITIPVSKETFIENGFGNYVHSIFQKYEIPYEFIRFKLKGENLRLNQYIGIMDDFISYGIGMDTTSIEMGLSYPFNAIHMDYKKLDEKWIDYLKAIKQVLEQHQIALVIRNVNNKENKEQLNQIGLKYIEGSLYKKISADKLYIKIKGAQNDVD